MGGAKLAVCAESRGVSNHMSSWVGETPQLLSVEDAIGTEVWEIGELVADEVWCVIDVVYRGGAGEPVEVTGVTAKAVFDLDEETHRWMGTIWCNMGGVEAEDGLN